MKVLLVGIQDPITAEALSHLETGGQMITPYFVKKFKEIEDASGHDLDLARVDADPSLPPEEEAFYALFGGDRDIPVLVLTEKHSSKTRDWRQHSAFDCLFKEQINQ